MENISHSVIGLAAGELIHRALPQEKSPDQQKLRRTLLLIASFLAGSFPDLDIVYTNLLPEPLGYLLHHRGHTHTIFYSVPQALLLTFGIPLVWKSARRLLSQSRAATIGFISTIFLGFILHLGLDYLNSYGIHPFHPFDNDWIFGDTIFIVEPVFWILFGAPLAINLKRTWAKVLCLTFLIGAPLAFTLLGYLNWPSFIFLLSIAAVPSVWQWRRSSSTRPLVLSFALGLAFIGVQTLISDQARSSLKTLLSSNSDSFKLNDLSLSSLPSNPLCWMYVSVEEDIKNERYRIGRGIFSPAPSMTPVSACPRKFLGPAKSEDRQMLVLDQKIGSLKKLKDLAAKNCFFRAWMRFARAPLIDEEKAWDARFMRSGRDTNFTLINLQKLEKQDCPERVPQWGFPRSEWI